jgi:hypothetical protein
VDPQRQACLGTTVAGEELLVNPERDAGGHRPPATKTPRTGDAPDHRTSIDDEADDPESPGATIDEPTPAEPNEPG